MKCDTNAVVIVFSYMGLEIANLHWKVFCDFFAQAQKEPILVDMQFVKIEKGFVGTFYIEMFPERFFILQSVSEPHIEYLVGRFGNPSVFQTEAMFEIY